MPLSQLKLLLDKNVRYMWRSKCWTIFEVVLPLIVSLPLALIVAGLFTNEKSPATILKSFNVTGDWRDLYRTIPQVQSIDNYYCRKPMIFGVAFSDMKRKKEIQQFVKKLQSRYRTETDSVSSNKFNITVLLFESEASLWNVLKNDAQGDQFCSRNYIGGMSIKKYDLKSLKFEYKLELESRNSLLFQAWNFGEGPWFSDDPYSITDDTSPVTAGRKNYWSPGLLSFQFAIDDIFIKSANVSEQGTEFSLELEKMPYPAFFQKSLEAFLAFLVFLWPLLAVSNIIHTVSIIAGEKGSGMTAYLQVMGLSSLEFYLSHGIISFLKLIIVFLPCGWILLPGFVVVSGSLFIFAILVYSVGVVCFSLLISSLFHKPASAVKGALIIWILTIILEAICRFKIPATHVMRCIIASLNINFALTMATKAIQDSMHRDLFLGFSNCFDGSYFFFTFGLGVVMMIFDIFWMAMLTIYLDNVYRPGDLPRKGLLYFLPTFCEVSKQINSDLEIDCDENDKNDNIQPEEKARRAHEADINVRGITKVYETVRAVDSLSFRAYRDNVTVLLGHNGAGKSTTFAMLTGLAAPTAGTIEICGVKLGSDTLKQCQRNLGFCPQYNPIFGLLTVREHLVFFRRLKGNPQNSVDVLLEELQLKDKANEFAQNLSGGMKRKLCVAMALVGGSQVVLLDEPTAGLDVGAKHIVNDLLERYKVGRTILLTTHFMDEADRLGDRISIMVSGRLACSGSSEFLKARFGTGYLLSIALKQQTNLNSKEQIMSTIRYYVENAHIQSETSQQFTVLLPVEHKAKFSALFAELENGSLVFGIDSFGISLNSLEQVFLKVGEIADHTNQANEDGVDMAKQQALRLCDNSQRVNRGCQLWIQQLKALFLKQFIYTSRKWCRLVTQFVMPLLLLIFCCYAIRKESSPHPRFSHNEMYIRVDELAPALILFKVGNHSDDFERNLESLIKKIGAYDMKQLPPFQSMQQFILDRPKVMPPLGMGFVLSSNKSSLITRVKAFFNGNARRGPVVTLASISNGRLGGNPDAISMSFQTYDASFSQNSSPSQNDLLESEHILTPLLVFVFSFFISGFIMQLVDEKRSNFKHQQLLTGLSPLLYWLAAFIFNFILYFISCVLVLLIFWIFDFSVSASVSLFQLLLFWACMPFMSCASFLFSSSVKAYTLMMLYMLLIPLFSFPIQLLLLTNYPDWYSVVEPMFMLLEPNYPFTVGTANLLSESPSYNWQVYYKPALMLFGYGAVFTLLLIALQTRLIGFLIVKAIDSRRRTVASSDEDIDITDERRRIRNISEEELAISVRDLNKYYGSFHALKNLSFGVQVDECFGLLGANGAGKTTTFDILTGVTLCNRGMAMINNQPADKIQAIGFCPQFDALLEELTARETLNLMVALRGYGDIKERVENVLDAIALKGKSDKLIYKYSGGQRRRLSVGLALVSQARVILLDEPTAGIDPKTRRHIWDLLGAMRDESCAMLLTSHSMEECEALCTRIGILLRGCLVAIGAPQHIKSRFGRGYTLTFTLRDERVREQLIEAVNAHFPGAVLKTLHPSVNLVWHLQMSNEDRWSKIFETVHQFASSRPEVLDYSVAQTTLEEAFLSLSQVDDDNPSTHAHTNVSLDVSSIV